MDAPAREPWTVLRLLTWTREYFDKQGVDEPRLSAELLLARALGRSRIELYTRHDHVPDDDCLKRFRESVREAAEGCPIAYLTGEREFFSLPFQVTRDVLIPRPETEVLVERTIRLVRAGELAAPRICEIGVGSGCVAITLARHLPTARVCASDVSEAAIAVARGNCERHGVSDRVELRQGDLFAPWHAESFDVIVSNPPYIGETEAAELPACVRDYEPHVALFGGSSGLGVHERLAAEAPYRLAPEGHLLVEVAYNQAAQVRGLLERAGWTQVQGYFDSLRFERVVHARRGPHRS